MTTKSSQKSGKIDKARSLRGLIRLADFSAEDKRPEIALYILDSSHRLMYTAQVDEENQFEIPEEILAKAQFVAIGPEVEKFEELDSENLMTYKAAQFQAQLADFPELIVAKPNWYPWLYITRCVTGSVSHCYPYPWLVANLVKQAAAVQPIQYQTQPLTKSLKTHFSVAQQTQLSDLLIAKPLQTLFPFYKCEPVCDGIVEVYRRFCCCKPWVLADPRLPKLVDILEDLILQYPPIKWPPKPEPDPAPFRTLPFFKEGALDELALNAKKDLAAIKSLPEAQVIEYIQARSYLFCWWDCGDPVKVAEGSILVGGKFNICWKDFLWFLFPNCHMEFAFKVKQNINGQIITIYDGVAANKWYHYNEEANLVSYHPKAIGCGQDPFPEDGPIALLQDIGLAHSYRLKTPDATGWDRVASPGYNDGLADPVANPFDALGAYKNRNWGGTLSLRYHFGKEMKGLGAKYYRISVSAADSNGNPTGSRTYLSDGLSWNKYVGINVETEVLGPFSAGGENNLFVIPYLDGSVDWHSGQYHGYLKNTDFANGRHLVTLEVFDTAGNRLRPTGAGGAGVDTPFTFRRWFQPIGPTANVPFAALTHMFWWDNREAIAEIDDLRMNGAPSAEQCQFLEGPGGSTFSVGYRAYHPEPMFLLNHSLWWRRGLGGPTGYLVNASPFNVGPAMGVSPTETFANMLGSEAKCSFSLNLYVNVKTFNGFGTLDGYDDWDYAAFALEIV